MLDTTTLEQLRDVFASLRDEVTFKLRPSSHAAQEELLALAKDVASTSEKLSVVVEGEPVDTVALTLLRNGEPTGVTFRAVPGGHEFTSLVLAVLHANGQGRLPDAAFQQRIKALRPGALRTYMSLECTNCPDVVQALNLVALLNPGVTHEVVDGALAADEVTALGIQGVPAVFHGNTLLHSGKSTLAQLVETLEKTLGTQERAAPTEVQRYDVVVLGGGPAGVAAAVYSARKGLRTAVVAQKLGGQVQDTLGIENFIGVPTTTGPKLSADLGEHLRASGVEVLEHRSVDRVEDGAVKTVLLHGGERVEAVRVIVATGARWRELNVPGEKQYIGRGVAFCAHCDGPFYKGRPVAVVGGGNSGVEAALDLSNTSTHVTLLERADALKADQVLQDALRRRPNVTVLTGVAALEVLGDGAKANGLKYQERATGEEKVLAVDGVFVQIGLVPNSAPVKGLVELNGIGEIVVDARGRTRVPGIYAAGDVTPTPFKQIVIAAGEGAKVALTAFEDRQRAAA